MIERIKSDLLGSLFIFSLLMVFWLLISASVSWQHILVGVIFSGALAVFWSNLHIPGEYKTSFTIKQFYLLIVYFIKLGIDIVLANINVAMIVLNPRLPISPGIVIMRCDLERSLVRVLYVNSITLTPGTITVELEDNLLIVHALTEEVAHGLEEWPLYQRLMELEGEYRK
ncbi:MAG: Na+/H+ antiporter subunit E [Bacillota bacterium]|nr:Na+/H+ antiporter subunit E [Bacillota bacterium]